MIAITVARHEPWADEAQAWLIARDRGFWDMLWRGVRYEGTPGLWHALLWLPAHLGLPYASMSWLAAAIAIAGIYVLLRYAPFPWPLRVLLPFTFFLGYQYAVVARSYVLFPLLCFASAACFRMRPGGAIPLAISLALLANVSSHGFAAAAGLAIAYAWMVFRERLNAPRAFMPALAIYAAGALFAAATAWQPPDVSFVPPQFTHFLHGKDVAQALPPEHDAGPVQRHTAKQKAIRALELFSLGFSSSLIFSAIVVSACVAWLIARRAAVLLLPLVFLIFVLAAVYMSPWHAGMISITLMAAIWIAWPARPRMPDYGLAALLCAVCLLQIPWTLRAVTYDFRAAYDGSRACAAYLADMPGKKIFGYTPYSTGILPWFRANIFANQPRYSYWYWSKSNHAAQDPSEIAREHPDLVVIDYEESLPASGSKGNIGIDPAVDSLRKAARADGYQLTHDFTGRMPMQNGFTAVNHCEIYARSR